MGISLAVIDKLQELGLFGGGRTSVLDIGSSNLYSASADGIQRFLAAHGVPISPEVTAFAEKLARGSTYDPVSGGVNNSFVGELFEKAGMKYDAIDIADGYGTTILDLNHTPAPPHFVGAFDLVLNFGTTEHLLNQYNAFRVMHDSTKVGGYIVNSLPAVGYSDHGYITYTPRFFFDLAGYNEYELVGFWFEGPGGNNDLYAPIRNYQTYFPNLASTLSDREITETGRKVAALEIPDVGILVVYRKVKSRPFMGAIETSTSVGNVPASVTASYEPAEQKQGGGAPARDPRAATGVNADSIARHDEIVLAGEAQRLRELFVAKKLGIDECLQFYNLVLQAHGGFPHDWEYNVLLLGLEREPGRHDLSQRLGIVRDLLAAETSNPVKP